MVDLWELGILYFKKYLITLKEEIGLWSLIVKLYVNLFWIRLLPKILIKHSLGVSVDYWHVGQQAEWVFKGSPTLDCLAPTNWFLSAPFLQELQFWPLTLGIDLVYSAYKCRLALVTLLWVSRSLRFDLWSLLDPLALLCADAILDFTTSGISMILVINWTEWALKQISL